MGIKAHGELTLKLVDVKSLRRTEDGDYAEDMGTVEGLASAYAKNKPLPPLYTDASGRILDGHHRLDGAKMAKMKKVWVLQAPKITGGDDYDDF